MPLFKLQLETGFTVKITSVGLQKSMSEVVRQSLRLCNTNKSKAIRNFAYSPFKVELYKEIRNHAYSPFKENFLCIRIRIKLQKEVV